MKFLFTQTLLGLTVALSSPLPPLQSHRSLPILNDACEQSFVSCAADTQCMRCLSEVFDQSLDLYDLSEGDTCANMFDALQSAGACDNLIAATSRDLFCTQFLDCQSEGNFDDDTNPDPAGEIDCSTLTECNWNGFREEFISDGVCDHWTAGGNNCYNTEICGYDGGDCCEDKCTSGSEDWASCGSNGFYCADPTSSHCDTEYADTCPSVPTSAPTPTPNCLSNSELFQIKQYDSWGDGWNNAQQTITNSDGVVKYQGSLEEGTEATVKVCLAPGCYSVAVTSGDWGNEINWEVRKDSGGNVLANGGAPSECEFSVGANFCTNTCDGSAPAPAPIDPFNPTPVDDDEQNNQIQCISQHCQLQVTDCMADVMGCLPCISGQALPFCSSNSKYEALTKCEQCHCIEGMESSCDGSDGGKTCGAQAIAFGGKAVIDWQWCTNIGGVDNMVNDWDENDFGSLDTFESCAHAYHADPVNHGGKKASDCMQILQDAAKDVDDTEKDIVTSIASKLYDHPQEMCDCSSIAFTAVPNCNTFSRFKVLVHETLDACTSLDEVDCDAWKEFSDVCEPRVIAKFGVVDFGKLSQCDYVKNGCDNAGPFPSFRKLDCEGEIKRHNWDFWNAYSEGCALATTEDDDMNDVTPTPPSPTPPSPTPPSPTPPSPTPNVVPDIKPEKKGSGWGTALLVVAVAGGVIGGALFVKKRRDGNAFNAAYRYRPQRDEDAGSELFSGLSVNSGSFKPPSVPPMATHNI
ncbi:hypothetical protein TrLO_g1545 [Triparma laevis f. longispina]|uniref:LNR domain-containing protein n=1 Tax=Triparma laevis f. longispina TaxID=1714387 RepID=A0A9W7KZX6_9STRA|nr:hypothetical protein TrLO_g1545 [Triparma laevis f. longispina]